jgi:hypothetical protein
VPNENLISIPIMLYPTRITSQKSLRFDQRLEFSENGERGTQPHGDYSESFQLFEVNTKCKSILIA